PGAGYGGSCFPKDVTALLRTAQENGLELKVVRAVEDANERQKGVMADKIAKRFGDNLAGKRFAMWGLAFKPNTDDMREAPSVDIAKVLRAAGAEVRAYDPAAVEVSKRLLPDLEYRKDAYEVAAGADALVLITEWNEFRQLDLARVKQLMRRPVVVDGRNIYDPALMRSLGFTYRGIGRE
ncbi:MAG TPA: UDP binding domain-containing protein, partial [Candidatus Dormibacteraeota bacterium]|nr:UDP binding domain-containing protein [Candidatus Dormibacteraeota bacterium]